MFILAIKWKTRHRELCFYDEMASEWYLRNSSKSSFLLGDFNGHVLMVLNVCMREMQSGREMWR